MFRQAPSFPYHDLGIVEDGNTASRAISKDAYVIWKGSSYFASTDILQGATLEEDVNLTAIPDGVINGVVSALNNNFVQVWENQSPTASFASQTVSADLSAYRFVYVVTSDGSGLGLIGITRNTLILGNIPNNLRARSFRATSTGVFFSNGFSNDGTTTNDNCIPYSIFGIK